MLDKIHRFTPTPLTPSTPAHTHPSTLYQSEHCYKMSFWCECAFLQLGAVCWQIVARSMNPTHLLNSPPDQPPEKADI